MRGRYTGRIPAKLAACSQSDATVPLPDAKSIAAFLTDCAFAAVAARQGKLGRKALQEGLEHYAPMPAGDHTFFRTKLITGPLKTKAAALAQHVLGELSRDATRHGFDTWWRAALLWLPVAVDDFDKSILDFLHEAAMGAPIDGDATAVGPVRLYRTGTGVPEEESAARPDVEQSPTARTPSDVATGGAPARPGDAGESDGSVYHADPVRDAAPDDGDRDAHPSDTEHIELDDVDADSVEHALFTASPPDATRPTEPGTRRPTSSQIARKTTVRQRAPNPPDTSRLVPGGGSHLPPQSTRVSGSARPSEQTEWRAPSARQVLDSDTEIPIADFVAQTLTPQERELYTFLRRLPLFSFLADDRLVPLLRKTKLESRSIGETIAEEGEQAAALAILFSGAVRLYRKGPQSDEPVSLALLNKGDVFGEVAVVTGLPSQVGARCSDDTTLLLIPADDFRAEMAENEGFREFCHEYVHEFYLRNFIKLFTGFGEGLSPRDLQKLVNNLVTRAVPANTVLYKQGDAADSIFVVKRGTVGLYLRTRDGNAREVDRYDEGEVFGAAECIEAADVEGEDGGEAKPPPDPVRPLTAVAGTEAEVLVLPRAILLELLESNPDLERHFKVRYQAAVLQQRDQHILFRRAQGVEAVRQGTLTAVRADEAEREKAKAKPKKKRGAGETTLPTGEDLFASSDREALRRGWRGYWSTIGRRFNLVPFIQQHDETDCGSACIAMIARYYGTKLGLGRLRELTKMTVLGASIPNLIEASETIGFTAQVVRPTSVQMLGRVPLPAIAYVKGYHYVVVWKVTGQHVIIGDPAVGTRRLTHAQFEKDWVGTLAIVLRPTEDLAKQRESKWSFVPYLPLVAPYKGLLLEVMLASLILDGFGLALPFFTQIIVDQVVVHENTGLLNLMLAGMLIVTVFQLVMSWLRGYLIAHVSVKVDLRMLTLFYRHLMSLPLMFFKSRKTGDLLARFGENTKIRKILTEAFITTVLDVLMIFVYLAVMFYYNWKLALMVVAFIPAYVLLMVFSRPVLKKLSNQMFYANADQESTLVESLAGVQTVKAAGMEARTRGKWEGSMARFLAVYFRGMRTQLSLSTTAMGIQGVATVLLLWYGASQVISHELSIGQLMAFNVLVGLVMAPIGKLVQFWDEYHEATISMDRLSDVFQIQPEVPADMLIQAYDNRPILEGGVEFQDVTFAYHESAVALQHVSFKVEPGSLVALVGRSGCGKTTLASLMLRLYKADEGKILIDGHDISSLDLNYLRKSVGFVVQENYLFSGSILENIALGDDRPSQIKAEVAAKVACAHQFIARLPFGYDTVVGERGASLSGGERQRICIARAVYQNPQILIFDESTSALDYQTEREIMENIRAVYRGRTLFVIAHRLSTITNAHKIIVMDSGQIRESGTHDELVAQRGLYFHLLKQQAGRLELT